MTFELSREQFRTMILYNWKVALTCKESHAVSWDLSPCDLFLFPKLKKQLRGIQFGDDNAMLNVLEEAIESLTKDDFKNCFDDWFCRMHKFIEAKGNEKNT